MKISITLGEVGDAIKQVNEYKKLFEKKKKDFMQKLAEFGQRNAKLLYPSDIKVDVYWKDDNTIVVRASGEEVAFIEFGTGITYGGGHPDPVVYNDGVAIPMGKGTFPSEKGHWDDPNGWWYPIGDGNYVHTYGNPPSASMYNTARAMEQEVQAIVKEVFG
jgi:hypothetical protein